MLPFEGLVVAYFAFFAVAAPFARVARLTRARVVLTAASVAAAVFIAARTLPIDVRLWLAFAYIGLGYWVPVPLVPSFGGGAFEDWLVRTDAAVRGAVAALPGWLVHVAELGYLACFPLVPASFAAVWAMGERADVARYWLAVLAAAYVCYGTLPWLVSRPPRLLEEGVAAGTPTPVARLNVLVLGRVSHHLTTFPSGHVAVSVAAAIRVGEIWPAGGFGFGIVALGVAAGAVAGRYHFLADVAAGAVLGAIVTLL